jgi:hypothetical protein
MASRHLRSDIALISTGPETAGHRLKKTGKEKHHARGNAEHRRRDQAGRKPAEEASLTGIKR